VPGPGRACLGALGGRRFTEPGLARRPLGNRTQFAIELVGGSRILAVGTVRHDQKLASNANSEGTNFGNDSAANRTRLGRMDELASPAPGRWLPGSPRFYDQLVLRPASWSRLTGESPVRVGTGAPGSRPRFVVETRRAERGVKSLFGGSKRAGCSVKRTLQPRQMYKGGAEPVTSRRRPCLAGPVPGSACRVPPGYGGWHVRTVWAGTGEARLASLRRAETRCISRW
jgi:hypothetical protein